MYEQNVQSVLRCGQCNKPFDKQSTLTRHGYYCRSRRAGSATRSRSCISCARGKARCDTKRPECTRCKTKAVECHYPTNTPKGADRAAPTNQHSVDAPTERRTRAPSLVLNPPSVEDVGNVQEIPNGGDKPRDHALVMPDPEFANFGEDYLGWIVPDIDFADFPDMQTGEETVQDPLPQSSSLVRQSTPSTRGKVQVQQAVFSPNVSIPTFPTQAARSLVQRPKVKTAAQRTANLIFHTLKSYPLMIMRQNTLPPFIHPHLICSDIENSDMEPLYNCISLVRMIGSRVQGSRKLFWRNVRLECERLSEEHRKLNKWELLAALQALSVYIVIRLDEGETDYNNFDMLLLATVTILSKQLASSDVTRNTESALYQTALDLSWKDWIFQESIRRLCVVYQVMNMIVYFEPAAMCDLPMDLILAPLPAKKQLWDAGDAFVWKAESERDPAGQTAFGLVANGELVKVDEDWVNCSHAPLHQSLNTRTPSRSNANWEEWCLGIDGFGGLVMLAASLIV